MDNGGEGDGGTYILARDEGDVYFSGEVACSVVSRLSLLRTLPSRGKGS